MKPSNSYDYRTRYYDPYLGRFLRIDTIGLWGDPNNLGNPYAYCGNNPWSRRDPFGEGFLGWVLSGDWEVFGDTCHERGGTLDGSGRLGFVQVASVVLGLMRALRP